MNIRDRDLLQRFSGGERPLNRAIAAALHEIDRLRSELARERAERADKDRPISGD